MSNAVACLLVLGMALLGSSGQAQVWEKKALSLDAARKMVRGIEVPRQCPPRPLEVIRPVVNVGEHPGQRVQN